MAQKKAESASDNVTQLKGELNTVKITIQSTTRIVQVDPGTGCEMACRVWEGETEGGVKVQVLVPRIAALADQDLSQFDRELQEQAAPSPAVECFPLRMIL
jgi:hypothetical protein